MSEEREHESLLRDFFLFVEVSSMTRGDYLTSLNALEWKIIACDVFFQHNNESAFPID